MGCSIEADSLWMSVFEEERLVFEEEFRTRMHSQSVGEGRRGSSLMVEGDRRFL